MDGKLYIIITDKPEVETTTTVTAKKQVKKQTKIESTQPDSETFNYATHEFYHFMKSTAIETVNWSIGNIGNFTGNYDQQVELQKTMSLASKLSGIGMSIASGAMTAGPVGALVAGTIAIAGTLLNIGLEERVKSFNVQKQNREIEQLRELSGLNPLTNGGRI